jgi:hypothetical protein
VGLVGVGLLVPRHLIGTRQTRQTSNMILEDPSSSRVARTQSPSAGGAPQDPRRVARTSSADQASHPSGILDGPETQLQPARADQDLGSRAVIPLQVTYGCSRRRPDFLFCCSIEVTSRHWMDQ